MSPCNAESLNRAFSEGLDNISRSDLTHGLIKWIDLVVPFSFRRPDIFAEKFLAERLIVIYPPEVH